MIRIQRDTIDNNDFHGLVRSLDDELRSRYGVVQDQYEKYNRIQTLDAVVIGYLNDIPVGCGAFRIIDTLTVEIKRMMVIPGSRGSGIAGMILNELEIWAVEKGFSRSVLETGIKQPEAIRFYSKSGYSTIDNYGPYVGNTNSICMGKKMIQYDR